MSKLSQARVLIVDDEADMVQLIALMLQKLHVDVLTASNGQEALDITLKGKPDVIVSDLMMPEVDGFTFMEELFAQNLQIPVIVTTAYGSMDTAIQALKLGAFDFLLKPLKPETVRASVSKAFQNQFSQKVEYWKQQITDALSGLRDPLQTIQKLLSLSAEALGAEGGFVSWAEQPNAPIFLNSTDEVQQEALLSWAINQDLINGTHPGSNGKLASDIKIGSFSGSMIGFPFVAHNVNQCVLGLAHSQSNFYNQRDLSFLQIIMPFVALTIDNAKIYTNLKTTNQRLQTLQSINALTYNAKLPLNRILRLTVEGIRQNLGYPGVMICLPESNAERLTVRAAAGHLDKFLRRRGDSPTRRISFPLKDRENPFTLSLTAQSVQDHPVEAWAEALRRAGAGDMAQSLLKQQVLRCLAFPLWQSEEVIGIMVIGYAHNQPLSPEERTLLTTLASQSALIITNAKLYQAEQQGRREMAALYQAGLVITSTLSKAEVLKAIIRQMVELTQVESCIIGRWDTTKNTEVIELSLQRTNGNWQEKYPPGTAYSLEERPLVKTALANNEMKIVRWDDPDLPASERVWMDQMQAKIRLILPMIIRDKSIGVVELISDKSDQPFTNQIIRIAQGLAAQAAIALENARLHESEIKRIDQEMDLAQRIQISLLPTETPAVPGLSIAARSVSARLVGGDFYRYLSLPNKQFGVVVGDVSGKGVPSALFMAITITAMDTQIRQLASPGTMLSQLNTVLLPRMQANGMNTGLLVAIFDVEQNNLQIANAGMIAPLVKQGSNFRWLDVSGFPVGAVAQTTYYNKTIPLTPNTTIILVSDGIIEAQNKSSEMYGFERFQEAAYQIKSTADSRQILEHFWQDVLDFTEGAEPHDDMTLVVVQTNGDRPKNGKGNDQ